MSKVVGERRIDISEIQVIFARNLVSASATTLVPNDNVLNGNSASGNAGLSS
jgi:hypothetical protein